MDKISNGTILTNLQWRYAVKAFDPERKIPEEDWNTLQEALVLSPSSFGLQLWKFFNVVDPKLREQLPEHSWGQRQVVDASHLVVLSVKEEIGVEEVRHHIERIAEVRGVPAASLKEYQQVMEGFISARSPAAIQEWATRQVYIALGNILTTAAMMGIDACPMEGFDAAKYDEILGLPEKGFTARILCPLGYRSADDRYAHAKKVRYPIGRVMETL